jgi:hypothetical protein
LNERRGPFMAEEVHLRRPTALRAGDAGDLGVVASTHGGAELAAGAAEGDKHFAWHEGLALVRERTYIAGHRYTSSRLGG